MKIKMMSSVVHNNGLSYTFGKVFDTNENIEKSIAKEFVKSNLAVEIKETKEKPLKVKESKVKKDEV